MNDYQNTIAKLHQKAESAKDLGNLAEAEVFAAKVSELLTRHKLSLTDIEFSDLQDEEPIEKQCVRPGEWGEDQKWKRSKWQQALASKLAVYNACKILVHTGSNRVTFVGRKSDRDVVVYLFTTLVPKLDKLSRKEHRAAKREAYGWLPRGWRQSWLDGAVNGIGTKLREQQQRVEVEVEASGNGTALIRLTGKDVGLWVNERYKGSAPGMNGTRDGSGDAYQRGQAHGRSTNLNTGVGGSVSRKALV